MLQPLNNNAQRVKTSQSVSIPAPVKGWNARDSLANMPEDFAVVLENVFPNLTSCDLRRGYESHSTGNGTGAVTVSSLFKLALNHGWQGSTAA